METEARRQLRRAPSARRAALRAFALRLAALAVASTLAPAAARAQCDNGVAISGTACKTQGDAIEYVCQPGSTPGNSIWKAVACVGGTCQGASCPAGCDNGVAIGGTACKSQGDAVQYVCQPGSTPGNSFWQAQSCNGGTCQGAACTAAPPPPTSGCDNGVAIGGTACKTQGDAVEYVCQAGSTPGHSLWQAQSCNGGTCQGAACTAAPPPPTTAPGCDNGVPVGGTACAHPGDAVAYVCQPGSTPGNSIWTSVSCNGGLCLGSACTTSAASLAGCDNGVPVGGTACARQNDPTQYLCLAGSTPGHNLWQAQTCPEGAVCRGSACTSAASTTAGCDNGVPVGGTACANDGDSVQYACQPGSTPGHSLWVAQSCGGGACHVYRCTWELEWDWVPGGGGFGMGIGFGGGVGVPVVHVGRGTMQVDANYTDLGAPPAGSLEADLDRLRRVGVRNVRIWADDGTGPDENAMAQRVGAVATAARARGMGVVVDLFDAHRNAPTDPETINIPGVNELLRRRFQTIVAPNRGHTNVTWSIGNEIVGPSTPLAFANWYRDRVRELRAAGGRRVVAELVPGAVEHFINDECWRAAKIIVNASDAVSMHYYYKESGPPDEDRDFKSLVVWLTLARSKFQMGEVGVENESKTLSQEERYRRLTELLARFQNMNVREVKIWQFLKDEPSHFDRYGFDLNDKPDISPRLIADHWLFPPR